LVAIGQTVAAELDTERVVQAVTGAQFSAFFYNVVNERGEAYTLYTISGVPREHFAQFPMPRNTPVFGPTFHGEGVVRLDDVTRDPLYGQMAPYHGMPPGHLPVRSYLAVPVLARGHGARWTLLRACGAGPLPGAR
jgi:GAF domain-containing protein